MEQQPLVGQDPLVFEASRSHTDTPQSVGLLWTSDVLSQRPLLHKIQHSRETAMSPAEFEPAITASERPQTLVLDSAATGIGELRLMCIK
jgi:hypothetical protein